MNDQIAVGAFALVASISTVAIGSRWYARPLGEHRKPRARAVLDEAALDELLPPWPEPVFGAAVVQAWRPCGGTCEGDMPSVLHPSGWTCGHCLTTTTTRGTDEHAHSVRA